MSDKIPNVVPLLTDSRQTVESLCTLLLDGSRPFRHEQQRYTRFVGPEVG